MGTTGGGRYPGVSRYARIAALLVDHEAIPARGLGATCRLARAEPALERDAEFIHHRLVVPYQTNVQISGKGICAFYSRVRKLKGEIGFD